MKRIAIIHYQPLEYYPPTTNTINYIAQHKRGTLKLLVCTSKNVKQRNDFVSKHISIKRSPFPKEGDCSIRSLMKQAWFNLYTLAQLVNFKPDTILYYETYSAFPVYFYLKYLNSKTKLHIHFHEYFSKDWYSSGMKLVKLYHKLEMAYLFPKALSISQTNEERVKLFLKDHPIVGKNRMVVRPNYPPSNWLKSNSINEGKGDLVKLVYIGSLSLTSTYIRELCEWVTEKRNKFALDIYCYNSDKETSAYLNSLNKRNIKFFPHGLDYYEIPNVLSRYDVGVILYKGNSHNSRYCASNKLFEYLSCGLDVWFSDKMVGTYQYIRQDRIPKVVKVNFESLRSFNYVEALSHKNLTEAKSNYTSEEVNYELLLRLYQE